MYYLQTESLHYTAGIPLQFLILYEVAPGELLGLCHFQRPVGVAKHILVTSMCKMHNFLSHYLLGLCCQELGYGYDPPLPEQTDSLRSLGDTGRHHSLLRISWLLAVTLATPSPWAYASSLALNLASLALHLGRGVKRTVCEGGD